MKRRRRSSEAEEGEITSEAEGELIDLAVDSPSSSHSSATLTPSPSLSSNLQLAAITSPTINAAVSKPLLLPDPSGKPLDF